MCEYQYILSYGMLYVCIHVCLYCVCICIYNCYMLASCQTHVGREQMLSHHSLQPSILHHTAESSPQRMAPLLSSHNQFTLQTHEQDGSTINGQNVTSSEMQQVLIQVSIKYEVKVRGLVNTYCIFA